MRRVVAVIAVVMLMPAAAGAQSIVTLKNRFIEDNKERGGRLQRSVNARHSTLDSYA